MKDDDSSIFASKPVVTWEQAQPLPDPAVNAIRLSIDPYDGELTFEQYFEAFLRQPGLDRIDTLLLGVWAESYESNIEVPLQLLVNAAGQLPALRHLGLADMVAEECEVSWIQQGDIFPLYPAFPALETLYIKGAEGLNLGEMRLTHLKSLILINGGLSARVLGQITQADLPALEHLEIWLGEENYGCDIQDEDIMKLLESLTSFPQLRSLALCNFEYADELAKLIANTPLPAGLRTLDLSKGTLTDTGAQALLDAPGHFSSLEKLDLHYHFLSDAMMERMKALPCGVDLSGQQEAETYDDEVYRYIFLSE